MSDIREHRGTPAMTDELITLKDLRAVTNLGHTTIYAGIKSGIFPKPIKIGTSSRWLRSEVEAAIAKLAAQRSQY